MEEESKEHEETEIPLRSWTTLQLLIPPGRATAALSEGWTAMSYVSIQASTLNVARHVKPSDPHYVHPSLDRKETATTTHQQTATPATVLLL